MRLTRLRITGFKTFVEPTDIPIEPGLTGIVGPNGCGKSNLVEALRWVMGESSHKSMRASGMDDVIFSGSASRPARNTAEVMLALDNSERSAPAIFNDDEVLEVSRRIEREQGSAYRVNGREVRARDVQLLFADAATGARSPALVRQGQIGEIISAKPQARRRILEDAAGIAGLHARRREAELRLRQAEDNLVRVEDVLREIDAQAEGLRRQGRHAARYRALSAEIRRLEAVLQALAYLAARAEQEVAEAAAHADAVAVAVAATEQSRAATAQAVASHELAPRRVAEAAAAAALRRLLAARTELDHEERRAGERLADLARRIAEIEGDASRHAESRRDADATIARLTREAEDASRAGPQVDGARDALAEEVTSAEAALAEAEAGLSAAQSASAEIAARRAAIGTARAQESERAARLRREREAVEREVKALEAQRDLAGSIAVLVTAARDAEALVETGERQAAEARERLGPARETERRHRVAASEGERVAQRLETELRTLTKLFAAGPDRRWPPVLDAVVAEPGFEAALGAALGDDLHASTDPAAPLRWLKADPVEPDPALPSGVASLVRHVSGPSALIRRLAQIGIVEPTDGARLAAALAPGQRLVSRDGDLWRWDGLSSSADAPSAAAKRLAERNRVAELDRAAVEARRLAEAARAEAEGADTASREAVRAETDSAEAARKARRAHDAARDALAAAERRHGETASRRAALAEAKARLEASEIEVGIRLADAERAAQDLPDVTGAAARLATARDLAETRRREVAEARAALSGFDRERDAGARRRVALAADLATWTERAGRLAGVASDLATRLDAARADRDALAAAPDAFLQRRRALRAEIEIADAARRDAADSLVRAGSVLAEADRAARAGLDALAAARESRAASQARAEATGATLANAVRAIRDAFDTEPAGLLVLAGLTAGVAPPQRADAEARVASLRAERERLGGVNLRAEDELADTEAKQRDLAHERDDLAEAIRRLRGAVSALNREGRERLAAAFGIVAGHFTRLFETLFGGGTAELTLVDSDDPLEAGLEIVAKPPGKKPQSLSLLSGGEQALTAIALIFAVFLTNPSPICVLDEVDAPLDDANVERYCDLLRHMAGETQTRFVVITHNPVTMARMDRLFGVTMAERGVSQLVSVDLQVAQGLREVG